MSKKQVVFFASVFVFLSLPLFSSDETVHNQQLEQVLFGPVYTLSEKGHINLEALEKALYLCIDLYKGLTYNEGQAQRYLDDLKRFGVKNLPKLETIDFTANQYHQRYTHKGWDWTDYPKDKYPNIKTAKDPKEGDLPYQQIWNVRQQLVLLATIDRIFKFNQNEMEKRDSFAALLYYVHIMGDHIGDTRATYPDRIPLTRKLDPGKDYKTNHEEDKDKTSIYTELLWIMPRLFREQANTIPSSIDYETIISYLERNKNRIYPVENDKDYENIKKFAQETLSVLYRYIPQLLQGENFFKKAF